MLRISKKADYAIFVLATMARKGHSERLTNSDRDAAEASSTPALMTANELADDGHLSRALVANLLKDLARAGLLESVRGQNGGYRLNHDAHRISLKSILDIVEGPINFVQCAGHSDIDDAADGPKRKDRCELTAICPSRGPLLVLHNRIVDMLSSLSLHEIAFSHEAFVPGNISQDAAALPLHSGSSRS